MYEPKFYLQLANDQPILVTLAELKELPGGVWIIRPMPAMLEEGDDDDDTNEN